jgi:TetR/AcrR family fatty acid metabolism transcriptional regulator
MPKRVDRGARREEILAGAVRVFARKGFAATRVEDVAAEAGIAKGSVYLYFDGLDDLLGAAFASFGAASERVLADTRAGNGDVFDRLGRLIRSVLSLVSAEPDLARILVDLWAAGRGGAAPPVDMAASYAAYRAAITDLLKEGAAAGRVRPGVGEAHATVVVGAIEGCLLQWLMDPRLPIADLAGPIADVLVDGLRAPGTDTAVTDAARIGGTAHGTGTASDGEAGDDRTAARDGAVGDCGVAAAGDGGGAGGDGASVGGRAAVLDGSADGGGAESGDGDGGGPVQGDGGVAAGGGGETVGGDAARQGDR